MCDIIILQTVIKIQIINMYSFIFITGCKVFGGVMKSKVMEELESYIFDYQYFLEKSKDIDKLKKEIDNMLYKINDMKLKKFDTQDAEEQLNILVLNHSKENKSLQRLIVQREKIENRIEEVPQPYKNILYLKYIKGNSFEEIAKKMHYSTKRIYQLHKEGIKIYTQYVEEISVPEISKN